MHHSRGYCTVRYYIRFRYIRPCCCRYRRSRDHSGNNTSVRFRASHDGFGDVSFFGIKAMISPPKEKWKCRLQFSCLSFIAASAMFYESTKPTVVISVFGRSRSLAISLSKTGTTNDPKALPKNDR